MDKETAKALNDWIKDARRNIAGDTDNWARGYRAALNEFAAVVRRAKAGQLEQENTSVAN